jgi:hypothetical protein
MVCTDMSEAEQVGRQLSKVDMGCLVTYRRAEDLMSNAPSGRVALVILAADEDAARTSRTLVWLRRRWSRSPMVVIGDQGGGEQELIARQGGAYYLTRPVADPQWTSMLSHVLGETTRRRGRESPVETS